MIRGLLVLVCVLSVISAAHFLDASFAGWRGAVSNCILFFLSVISAFLILWGLLDSLEQPEKLKRKKLE